MSTTAMLKKKNKLEILNVLKRAEKISKPDMAKNTRLTLASVGSFINELLRQGLVTEEGCFDSQGGRKAVAYRFNKDRYYIIGIDMESNRITAGIYNLSGELSGELVQIGSPSVLSVEETLSRMIQTIQALLTVFDREKIIGIGIGVPGKVDTRNGMIIKLTNLVNWVNIPLKDIIERETGIPVYVERDTNATLSCLKWFTVTGGHSNVVYAGIGDGIGGGILIDNKVFHGSHGVAGEIGHISMDVHGAACNCGNRGCIEVIASENAIIRKVEAGLKEAGIPLERPLTIMDVIRLVKEENGIARAVLAEASKYIAIWLVNIIHSYGPSLIVLECRWLRELDEFFNGVVSDIYENTRLADRREISILMNPVEDAARKGSAMIVIERLFHDVEDNRLLE